MKVGIIGSGQMGSGIAQVCASKGLQVIVCDHDRQQLTKADTNIARSAKKLQSKGQLTADELDCCLNNIVYDTDQQSLVSCEIIIEAVSEDVSLKTTIWQQLDNIVNRQAIFASNTSSIPLTSLAASTTRPQQMIGMHFMNPVPIMRLVEIIPSMLTNETTIQQIVQLATLLGKETVISQDYPGFIVNRLLMPMINEAFEVLLSGIASAEDIDKGMKLGTNQPLGPLALADLIGLDTCLAIMETLTNGLGDRYRPSPLLVKYVQAGRLGRKSGHGVYSY